RMLTGELPFETAGSLHALLDQIASREPVSPRKRNPAIEPDLETITLKAMAKEASARYATAGYLAEDLRCVLNHEPIQARRPTVVQRLRRLAQRKVDVVLAALATLLVLVVASIISLVLVSRERAEAQRQRAIAQAERDTAISLRALAQRQVDIDTQIAE